MPRWSWRALSLSACAGNATPAGPRNKFLDENTQIVVREQPSGHESQGSPTKKGSREHARARNHRQHFRVNSNKSPPRGRKGACHMITPCAAGASHLAREIAGALQTKFFNGELCQQHIRSCTSCGNVGLKMPTLVRRTRTLASDSHVVARNHTDQDRSKAERVGKGQGLLDMRGHLQKETRACRHQAELHHQRQRGEGEQGDPGVEGSDPCTLDHIKR